MGDRSGDGCGDDGAAEEAGGHGLHPARDGRARHQGTTLRSVSGAPGAAGFSARRHRRPLVQSGPRSHLQDRQPSRRARAGARATRRRARRARRPAARAPSRSSAPPASARRGCSPSSPRAPTPRGHIVLDGVGRRARARPPVLGLRRRARRLPRQRRPATRWADLDEDVRAELAHVSSRRSPKLGRGGDRRPGRRALPDQSRGPRAARAARCDQAAGADPRRLPLGRPGLGRPGRQPAAATARRGRAARAGCARRTQGPARLRAHSSERCASGASTRIELDPLTGEEAAEMLGFEPSGPRDRGPATTTRAATRSTWSSSPVPPANRGPGPPGVEPSDARAAGAADGGRRDDGGARAALRRKPAGAARARRSPATRSSPSSRRPRPTSTEQQAMDAIDELLARRPRPADQRAADAFASAIRSCAAPSTRPRPAAWRIGAHRPSARKPWRDRGASTAGARPPHRRRRPRSATRPPWRRWPRPAGSRRSARRRRRRAGSPARCACCRTPPPPTSASSCCSASATALAATGRFADAHEALARKPRARRRDADRAARPAGRPPARASSTCSAATTQAHARLAAALDDLPDAAGAAAVSLMLELAADERLPAARTTPGQDWAHRAVDAAEAIGDPALTAAALAHARARAGMGRGGRAAASRCAPRRPRSSTRCTDEQLAGRLDAAVELAGAEIYLDRFVEAGAHAERALAVGRATGQGAAVPRRLRDARRRLVHARSPRRRGRAARRGHRGRAPVGPPAGAGLGAVLPRVRRGSRPATSRPPSPPPRRAWTSPARPARASSPPGPRRSWPSRCSTPASPTRAAAVARRAARAQSSSPPSRRLARLPPRADDPLLAGARPPRRRRARRCRRAGQRRGGRPALADSDGPPRDAQPSPWPPGTPPTAATAGAARGRCSPTPSACRSRPPSPAPSPAARWPQLGDKDRAVAELEQAAAELDRCGAVRYRDAAQRELRQLGQHIHRRTRPGRPRQRGVGALTGRELEIAELIVDRKTNAEIAARAVPQQEDRRDAHPQHVPQARRQLARRDRSGRRTRAPGHGLTAGGRRATRRKG